MKVEVDQSTKIEQAGPTILAFANGCSSAVVIPATVKHTIFDILRSKGKSKETALSLIFAAGVYLLLEDYWHQLKGILIDIEYTGKERNIKAALLRYIWRKQPAFDERLIRFGLIGKKSPADMKARMVRLKKDKDYRKLNLRELLAVLA